ncbi:MULTISPECIES: hypothetical protein [unclassified Paenibacillus]|uniref:hypothetical protein n=1 Tax=unclassified Paenibacillus TaxID=185978 RepID=UPI0003E2252F|nr:MULTISPECIES: hypothetical protein [unclassified Paenibacillus]ETT48475.1 hypothetical protein C162_14365 [Paenibacillus sp. FSL R7-269]OMF99259.1 hypothetical protein BK147_06670 [Paenibacillus sp. FSL R7-0337]
MIQVRPAKSALENEEGMNHLWLQIVPPGVAQNISLQLILPAGLHRSPNLNGAVEDSSGRIWINHTQSVTDLYIEIFTREPIPCGEYSLAAELSYTYDNGVFTTEREDIPLLVVSEEEAAQIRTDEEVVRRIKELRFLPDGGGANSSTSIEYTPAKLIRLDSSHISEWEKKYRVEGALEL